MGCGQSAVTPLETRPVRDAPVKEKEEVKSGVELMMKEAKAGNTIAVGEKPQKFGSREEELIWHVRQSWARCEPKAALIATIFYTRLFEIDPAVETLFQAVDMEQQATSLMVMIGKAVDFLDKPAQLIAALMASGRRHSKYGVVDYQYDSVGAALLWTLERELGVFWTPDVSTGWKWVYQVIVETMKRGAKQLTDAKKPAAATQEGQKAQEKDSAPVTAKTNSGTVTVNGNGPAHDTGQPLDASANAKAEGFTPE